MFLVVIGSDLYGDSFGIAHQLSTRELLVEMTYAPPIGTIVTVHFQHVHDDHQVDEIVVSAEVWSSAVSTPRTVMTGLRFLKFLEHGRAAVVH